MSTPEPQPLAPALASEMIEAIAAVYRPGGEIEPLMVDPDPGSAFVNVWLTAKGDPAGEYHGYEGGVLATAICEIQTLRRRVANLEGLPPEVEVPVAGPAVTGLAPNTAAIGSADFTLHVNGAGFDSTTVINWNGMDVPTTLVNENEVTMYVSPATWTHATAVPVTVHNGDVASHDTVYFQFTAL